MADVLMPVYGGVKKLLKALYGAVYAETVAAGGSLSSANTTTAALGSAASFDGSWEVNAFEQVCINGKADQEGAYTVSFGVLKSGVDPDGEITDDDVIVTFTSTRTVYAGIGFLRPLVKLAGRAFKVSYTNGSTAQGEFALQTSYGNNMFPISASDENEVLVTSDEQERDTFVAMAASNVTADAYAILVDLSDTTNFPHNRAGRVDLTNTFLSIDRDNTATGFVRIGIITRIDGTDADITFVQGVTFEKSDDRSLIRDRKISPSNLKCGVVSGDTPFILSAFKQTGVTAVNTGVSLDSPRGSSTVTPDVGDIIVAYGWSAGSFNASVSATYHSEYDATS